MKKEVIIVGGGPVGLFLASELKLAGVHPLVIERNSENDSHSLSIGGNRSVNERTLQTLDFRGITKEMLANDKQEFRDHPVNVVQDPAPDNDFIKFLANIGHKEVYGHFSFIPVTDEHDELTDFKKPINTNQEKLLDLLSVHANKLGVKVVKDTEVINIRKGNDEVTMELMNGKTLKADWVVGCDGGHSLVRKSVGFKFKETNPTMVMRSAVVKLANPESLKNRVIRNERGIIFTAPYPAPIRIFEFNLDRFDRHTDVSLKEFQDALRRIAGRDDLTVTNISNAFRFTDHAQQVENYQSGRVLLAGDSAHVHPPFGGQGLNLGIQDAANLGWKLGLVARGQAPVSLLDTYTKERHAPASLVLRNGQAQTALLRPDPQSLAIREMITELMDFKDTKHYFSEMLSSQYVEYERSKTDHPLVGRFIQDIRFKNDFRLGYVMNANRGKGIFLNLIGNESPNTIVRGWEDCIEVVNTQLVDHSDYPSFMLIRPDGYVAWASEDLTGVYSVTLREKLIKWFGPASFG